MGAALVERKPILSDKGTALMASCKSYEYRHYFCFRHLLELLGSKTFVAMLSRRLFLTSSEAEYVELKIITIVDFRIGCQEGLINTKGACLFCE
jgi:hypothetical protein